MRNTHLLTLAVAILAVVFSTLSAVAMVRDTHTPTYSASHTQVTYKKSKSNTVKSMIVQEANAIGVPASLALAVARAESNFSCSVRSKAGAIGVMQIKYATAKGIGYRGSAKGLFDCRTNIKWGLKYLKQALVKARGNHCVAAHLYYSGLYAKKMTRGSKKYCGRVMKYM